MPEKGIFVSDAAEKATASIVLNTEPGYQFKEDQIKALYHSSFKKCSEFTYR